MPSKPATTKKTVSSKAPSKTKPKQKRTAKVVVKPVATAPTPRLLPKPKRMWLKPWTWKRPHPPPPPRAKLSKARILAYRVLKHMWSNWKLFAGIIVIYGVLDIMLVRGLATTGDLSTFKATIDSALTGTTGAIQSSVSSLTYVFATSFNTSSPVTQIYESILLLVVSLAFIWALRQTTAKNHPRIRDSFYQGMYPLIPFLLVLFIMGLQLLPLAVAAWFYTQVVQSGIAVNPLQQILFGGAALVFVLWSLRMFTGSLFALYIVTLPDMTPLKAIRSARELVYKRRLVIWRKLLFLLLVLFLVAVLIELPLIWLVTGAAEWVFFCFSVVAIAYVHAYLYGLYREML